VGSYLAIRVFNLKVSIGVSIALLGAFIGGLVAYIYLKIKIKNHNIKFNVSKIKDKVSNKEIVKKIINYSLPLIIVSIASDIYGIIDLTFIIRGMTYLGYSASESETIASIIATWGQKICMIVNSVAMGISISLIPHMVSSYVQNNIEETNKKFNQAINVILVLSLPLTVGISLLSKQFYTLFYGESLFGGIILRFLVFMAFFASIHIVVSNALQSMNKFKTVYISTILGFVINAALDIPLIILFDKIGIYPYYGAIFATLIGYSFTFVVAFSYLKKHMKFNYNSIISTIKRIILPTILMMIPVIILNKYFNNNYTSRTMQIPIILLNALIGGLIYLYLIYKNGVLFDTFGESYINKIIGKFKKIFRKK
jgi:O-antigen/teichoic acid export membrane protein